MCVWWGGRHELLIIVCVKLWGVVCVCVGGGGDALFMIIESVCVHKMLGQLVVIFCYRLL